MTDPISPAGLAISNVWWITLAAASGIFLLVTVLVVYSAVRFRARPGQDEPHQDHGSTPLEIAWTAGPALLLAVLFVFTLVAMGNSDPAVAQEAQPEIVVIGHQWWWEVRYPASGVVTANEIHMPAGRRVLFRLESADVIHDLWIPRLGRKMDLIPGQPNELWIEADAPGVYAGQCSEYCGVEHGRMLVRAVAQTEADFAAWIAAQRQPAAPVSLNASTISRGAQVFMNKSCISCHTISGIPGGGTVGPDLTHLASRSTLASGIMDNSSANLSAWINGPQEIKPGANMPDVQLSAQELQELVAYLETLK